MDAAGEGTTVSGLYLTIHGSRGTASADGPGFARYGGGTNCLTTTWKDSEAILVLDAGSGAASASTAIAGKAAVTILLTHLHLDHLIGLPAVLTAAARASDVRLACAAYPAATVEAALRRLFTPPYWPFSLWNVCPALRVTDLPDDLAGGLSLRSADLTHPGQAVGYRIEAAGTGLAYLTDHEPDGADGDAAVRDLSDGADLALIDATWTPQEWRARRGWGHGDWVTALELTQKAGRVGLWHHAPGRDDDALDAIVEQARAIRPRTFAAASGQSGPVGDFSPGS